MSVFDEIKEILLNLFGINGDVFVKRKNISHETLETCNGLAYNDEKTKTCALCVALNQTVFHNYNKPEYYHLRCKCKNEKYNLIDIEEDFPIDKITKYLFVDVNKQKMMQSMGYNINDSEEIYNIIYNVLQKEFLNKNYKLGILDIRGQHFSINFTLKGKNDHLNENFSCHNGCIAYPYGKIKVATPLIKD